MRYFAAFALTLLLMTGCSTPRHGGTSRTPASQRWFLDPSTEFANYKTFGFLQVTAVRYDDPVGQPEKRGLFGKRASTNEERRLVTHHTDELIWRVLREELQAKGYTQVQPADADILVIYYGGPRPQLPPQALRMRPSPFDSYFARNELQAQTFWVDIIDNKQKALIYRGWDNDSFVKIAPGAEKTIAATRNVIGFFPSRRP